MIVVEQVLVCDVYGCGTSPAVTHEVARGYGHHRAVDLCEEHAAPFTALLAMSTAQHGTYTRYQDGCRCLDCRRSATSQRQRERLRARSRGLPPGDPRHGTENGYINQGCRCQSCRLAVAKVRTTG